jgi:outer membrane protein assembly factor BamB
MVYTVSANGDRYCLDLATGKKVWNVNFAKVFGAEPPEYGYCSSPTIADGKLIYNPGGAKAALSC